MPGFAEDPDGGFGVGEGEIKKSLMFTEAFGSSV